MPAKKRPTQQAKRLEAARRARAAAAATRRRTVRRRAMVGTAAVVMAAALVLGIVALGLGGGGNHTTGVATSSSTTVAGAASAAGKPCVAVSDPLPTGAPAVPVHVGPPPASLVTQDIKVGTGAVVTASQTLTVNYIGVSCSTGKIFDSSYASGQPATFALSGVIPGWQQGIPGMRVGGERLLGIPPDQAYGSQGHPPAIAPDETLWFVVDVIKAA